MDPAVGSGAEDADEAALLERGRLLFAAPCDFVAGADSLDRLPPAGLTEVAFAGRSNVGKSSLINALTNRGQLARTSNTPGRTQQVNFFDLGGRVLLVDLPGYGFAKAAKTDVRRWTTLVKTYLKGRVPLRRVFLLIDSRHGLKENDREIMAMLDGAAVGYQAVLTKADKPKSAELEACLAAATAELARHPAAHPEVLTTSAEKGLGIDVLRARVVALLEEHEPART
jgi:GTP-binding protein